MSCDPDVQYKIVLNLQSNWTRLYAGALHKLIHVYGTFSDSPYVVPVAREKSGNETIHSSEYADRWAKDYNIYR